ncbi:MAG: class I SAM-dependent methyltransferase [Granulosicoccus sp.]
MDKLKRYSDRVWQIGIFGSMLALYERRRNKALCQQYGFDSWHVGATFHARPYKKQAVRIANSLNPKTVVEIGCGLGDVIGRINASQNIGIDYDANVLNAASQLNKHCRFVEGSIYEIGAVLHRVNPGSIDILVMVNFLHSFTNEVLVDAMKSISDICRPAYLLVDMIYTSDLKFRNRHTLATFEYFGSIEDIIDCADGARKLVLVKLR